MTKKPDYLITHDGTRLPLRQEIEGGVITRGKPASFGWLKVPKEAIPTLRGEEVAYEMPDGRLVIFQSEAHAIIHKFTPKA